MPEAQGERGAPRRVAQMVPDGSESGWGPPDQRERDRVVKAQGERDAVCSWVMDGGNRCPATGRTHFHDGSLVRLVCPVHEGYADRAGWSRHMPDLSAERPAMRPTFGSATGGAAGGPDA